MYELKPHTADLILHVRASSLEELFDHSLKGLARAYLELYDEDLPRLPVQGERQVEIEGDSLEEIVHKLLREGVSAFDITRMIPTGFSLKELSYSSGTWRLKGSISLSKVPPEMVTGYVKAVTYHRYELKESYEYEVVLDL